MDAPDGYINLTDWGYGGSYVTCSVWFKNSHEHPQQKRYRTRGKARNCGSGPFFQATVRPTAVTTASGVITNQLFHTSNQTADYVTEKSVTPIAHAITVRKSDGKVMEVIRRQREVRDDTGSKVYAYTRVGSYIPKEKFMSLEASWDETCEAWIGYCRGLSDDVFVWRTWSSERVYGWYSTAGKTYRPVQYQFPDFNFKYGELDAFCWITDFGIYPKGWPARFQGCYLDAISSLEISDVNSLANILEGASAIVKFIADVRGILHGKFEIKGVASATRGRAVVPRSQIFDFASSKWLAYRYELMTTIMDLKSYKMMLKRLGDLASITGNIHSTGYRRFEDETYKVELIVDAMNVVPSSTVEFLAAVGVEPNLQNLWDLVPYSFVVDWFVNISRLAEIADQFGKAVELPVKQAWFTYMSEYNGQHVFMRLPGKRLNVLPAYAEHQLSTGTLVNRILDSLSLFHK